MMTTETTTHRHKTATNGMTKSHPIESQYRMSFLEFKALPVAGASSPAIHPNVSTQGPPTSRAVQVNPAKFSFGSFTEDLRLNRVRNATASGSAK
jgi:hypothetical protein